MKLDLDVDIRDRQAFLWVIGEIDVHTAPEFREQLVELIEQGHQHVVVNLDAVRFLDSTGLGALVGAFKRIRRRHGELTLVCTQPRILKMLEITGLNQVFTIRDTVPAAAAH